MNKVNTRNSSEHETRLSSFSDIVLNIHYPEENPKDTLDQISEALKYVGIFDSIDIDKSII